MTTQYTFERHPRPHAPQMHDYHVIVDGQCIAIIRRWKNRWELYDREGSPIYRDDGQFFPRRIHLYTLHSREEWPRWLDAVRGDIPTPEDIAQRKAAEAAAQAQKEREAADRARRARYAEHADEIRDCLQHGDGAHRHAVRELLAKLEGGDA